MSKAYLGDSVYVDIQHGMLVLTTENGLTATNTIYLEPEIYAALTRYVQGVTEAPLNIMGEEKP